MLIRALLSILAFVLLVANIESQNAPPKDAVSTDGLGDPLPPGAVARLGTLRFKHAPAQSAIIDSAVYSPDGTKIASLALTPGSVRLWEADTGKEIAGPWASSGARYSAVAFTPDSSKLVVGINPGYRPPNAVKDKSSRTTAILFDIAKKAQFKTISGPIQLVSAFCFVDGGKTLVGAGDGAVRWWDIDSGKEQRTWQPFADEQAKNNGPSPTYKTFNSCALSPDGRAIALQTDWRAEENRVISQRASPDTVNEVIGYELPSGKKYWQSSGKGPRAAKSQFVFSADGKRIAIVVGTEKVELRDGVNGKLLLAPLDLKTLVNGRPGGVALSADGSTLALASGDAKVFLYDTTKKDAEPRTFAARMPMTSSPALNGFVLPMVPGAANGLNSTAGVSFAPGDAKLLIGVDSDLQVYDAQSLREVAGTEGHHGWVNQIAFTPDGKKMVTGVTGRGQSNPEYFGPNGEVYFLIGGGPRGGQPALEQAAWDMATWKRSEFASAPTAPWPNVGALSLMQSAYVGKTGQDASRLFDLKSGKVIASMLIADKQLGAGVGFFSPSGKYFVHYAGENRPDAAERIYGVPSGKLVCKFVAVADNPNRGLSLSQTPPDPSENIAFSPNEKLVAQYGRGDGLIRVYETATGKLRHSLGDKVDNKLQRPFIVGENWDVAFSPDNRFMVSWSSLENFLRVWDMSDGTEVVYIPSDTLLGPAINSPGGQRRLKLAWSADGRVLAMGESRVRLLELATLGVRRELVGHENANVRAMAFAPGSRFFATASSDTTVLVWDMLRPSSSTLEGGSLSRAALETAWKALANQDAGAAYAAILQLVASPGESLSWIKEKVLPEIAIDPKQIETLIDSLNDDRFKFRESATAALLQIGARAAPAVDKALANNPTLETLRRLQSIRKNVTGPLLTGEKLQAVRGIETLEKIGTPEAIDILQALAGGAPGGLITTHARDALGRLKQ